MHVRCSGLARPMVCAGYSFLDLPPSPSNPKAEEGTAAGEYLERMLTDKPLALVASNGVRIDEDMKFHIKPINDDIRFRAGLGAREILCEQRINWMTRSGIEVRGSYDISFIDDRGYLCIEDLKYGWGIVEVKENWQLLGYAIGEVIRRGQAFEYISLKIHQPRPHHEDGTSREWLITYSELLEWKEKIEHRMQELRDGRKDMQTGSQCKYCQGAAEACPAFNRLFYRALEVSTEFYQDSLNNDEVSRQLDEVKRAEEVIKIKKDSLTELGTLRIKQGQIIPGYATIEKHGNRVWKNNITPESLKMMTGIDVTETKFATPAKAEKLGISRKLVSQLTSKAFLGVKLQKVDTTKIGNNIFGTEAPKGI